MPINKEEIGNDVTMTVGADDSEFEITSASYSEEPQTSSTQYNSSLSMNIVVTGVEYSGSFEHDGANSELRGVFFEQESGPKTEIASKIDKIVFEDSQSTYTFENVIVGSRSKDFPADDRTSVTYDFVAETLVRSDV
jgi:hypothetical protein|uniref:Uncharacterized protein n=1 Tax=uncultured virus TaxID=340016 RepID=D5L2K9_9VIRU|nr:hypothetical protein [uncultured virus]